MIIYKTTQLIMEFIERFGIKFYYNSKLVPKKHKCIYLFGSIHTNMSKEQLKEYLFTYSARVVANHGRIHKIQAESLKLGYVEYYIRAFGGYLKNLFKYNRKTAYYNTPFEREAYVNERNFEYKETNWREYKDK